MMESPRGDYNRSAEGQKQIYLKRLERYQLEHRRACDKYRQQQKEDNLSRVREESRIKRAYWVYRNKHRAREIDDNHKQRISTTEGTTTSVVPSKEFLVFLEAGADTFGQSSIRKISAALMVV